MPPSSAPPDPHREYALRFTAAVTADLARGRLPPDEVEIVTPFPPSLGPDERLWARGPFRLAELIAPGDGSYVRQNGFFFATGGLGLALTGAFAVAQAAGNSRRREQARLDTIPRWMEVTRGEIVVGSYGFYMATPDGLHPWAWQDVTMAGVVGPGLVDLSVELHDGQARWQLHSDWAELVFVAWAVARHPRHPQLRDRSWLPRPALPG